MRHLTRGIMMDKISMKCCKTHNYGSTLKKLGDHYTGKSKSMVRCPGISQPPLGVNGCKVIKK